MAGTLSELLLFVINNRLTRLWW